MPVLQTYLVLLLALRPHVNRWFLAADAFASLSSALIFLLEWCVALDSAQTAVWTGVVVLQWLTPPLFFALACVNMGVFLSNGESPCDAGCTNACCPLGMGADCWG